MEDRATDGSTATATVERDADVLRELRRVRRERRLGDIEWFDVLYRVYLFALVGTGIVLYVSDTIDDLIDEPIPADQILERWPSIAGVLAALVVGIGLQNGADGGPVSVESADVRHLLLSPIDRTRALVRPISQRVRSVAFAAATGFAIVGQLVGREVDGSRAAWAASGALFGAMLGALYVGAAVAAHALRLPRGVATAAALILVAWQGTTAWRIWDGGASGWERIGPTNLVGSVAVWGIRQRWLDVLALAAVAALVVGALALGGRLRLQPLERRGQLVSQLRFAATVQDIRTVVLLRRQLRAESTRSRPWVALHPARRPAARPSHRPRHLEHDAGHRLPTFVWRRGAAAFNRLPLSRIGRMAALAAVAGIVSVLAIDRSLLFLIVLVAVVYLLGLESLEPLSQEVDRPDLTDGFPVRRGWLFAHHLVAPAGALAVAGLIGAAAATIVEPSYAAAAFAIGVPVAWAGAIGALVTTVGDAADPIEVASTTLTGADRGSESPFALPEFAGFRSVGKGAIPIALSCIAAGPILALRVEPTAAMVGRSVIGVVLCLALAVWWVVRRDRLAIAIRRFFAAGRSTSPAGSP